MNPPILDEKHNPWIVLNVKLSVPTNIKCLIDTGFSGGIALPKYYFSLLSQKIPVTYEKFEFANGDQDEFAIYSVRVKCMKNAFDIRTMFIDNGVPLVGISFLKRYNFGMNIPHEKIGLSDYVKVSEL